MGRNGQYCPLTRKHEHPVNVMTPRTSDHREHHCFTKKSTDRQDIHVTSPWQLSVISGHRNPTQHKTTGIRRRYFFAHIKHSREREKVCMCMRVLSRGTQTSEKTDAPRKGVGEPQAGKGCTQVPRHQPCSRNWGHTSNRKNANTHGKECSRQARTFHVR